MVCSCDGSSPSAFWVETPKARKDHKCCECSGTIKAGETYTRYSGIWDGERASYKTCADCEDMAKWWQALVPCFCRSFGDLFDTIWEDASELDFEVPGTLEDVAVRMDAICEKRGARNLGYTTAAKEMAAERQLDEMPTTT